MRICKKIIAINIVSTILFSTMISLGAYATETDDISTTVNRNYYYDGFEDGIIATRENGTNDGAHYVSGTTGNGLFVEKPRDYDEYSNHVTVEANAGYNGEGDSALYVHTDTTATGASSDGGTNYRGTMPLGTKNLTVSASKGYLIQYKVKFDDFGTGVATTATGSGIQAAMSLCSVTAANESYMVYRHSGWSDNIPGAKAVFSEDVWYDVIWYTTYDGTTMVPHIRVINSETGEIVHSLDNFDNYDASKTKKFSEGNEYIFKPITLSHTSGENYCNGFKAYVDDFSIVEFAYDSRPALYVQRTNVENGEEGVARNVKLELYFDKPVLGDVTVKDSENNTITFAQSTAIGEFKIIVTFSELLERNETYIIFFDGVTDGESAACGISPISFKTEDIYLWNNIEVKGITQNDENVDIRFKLNDPRQYGVFKGAITAVKYENDVMKTVSSVYLNDVDVDADITGTFALGTLNENSQVKLIQLDLIGGPVVLAISE